jgi:hypothetical protein
MTEHERAEQFQRDVDALLRGETPSSADADDRALLDLARELLAADFSAETRLDLLRPKLAKPTLKGLIMSPRYRYVRWFVTTAALFTLIVAIILTVPPLRAIAQDILRQIGIFNFTDAPTHYELSQMPLPATDLVLSDSDMVWMDNDEESTDPASWYAILDYVPAGFEFAGYGWGNMHGRFVLQTRYARFDDPGAMLTVQKADMTFYERKIDYTAGDAQTETVTVRETDGVWIERFNARPDITVKTLVWEEQNTLFWLQSSVLDQAEMLRAAESVLITQIPYDRLAPAYIPQYLTPELAAVKVGFRVAVPQYLPDGFTLQTRGVFDQDEVTLVSAQYSSWKSAPPLYLSLTQSKYKGPLIPTDFPIGNATIEDVTINGHSGVWIGDYQVDDSRFFAILTWERDGFVFLIESTMRDKAETLQIAESLVYIAAETPEQLYAPRLRTVDEVAMLTRFPVAVPNDLPSGYMLTSRDARVLTETPSVITTYHNSDASDTLVFQQTKYPEPVSLETLAAGDAPLERVTVNYRRGYWIANYQNYPDERIGMLIWEQGGFIYRLQSATLGRDDMISIAKSLKYVGSPDF